MAQEKLALEPGTIEKLYNNLVSMIGKLGASIDQEVYSAFSAIFYNSIAYSLIGIILVFWAIKHLKSGVSKDDLFKAGTWLIILALVYGSLTSLGAYQEFKRFFDIPEGILKTVTSAFAGGGNMGQILGEIIEKPFNLWLEGRQAGVDSYVEENDGGPFDDILNEISAFMVMLLWLFYGIGVVFVCSLVIIMQVASTFAKFIFGSFAPLMIMCLLMPQLRGNFFAWLKNYIAITLFVPMTMFALMVMTKMNEFSGITEGKFIFDNAFYSFFVGLLGLLVAIYILKKIPDWINTMVGSSESGSGFGAGAAQAVMGAGAGAAMLAANGAGKLAMGTANIATGGKLAKGLENMKKNGGITGAIGRKLGFGKDKDKKQETTKNGMTATSQHYDKK